MREDTDVRRATTRSDPGGAIYKLAV